MATIDTPKANCTSQKQEFPREILPVFTGNLAVYSSKSLFHSFIFHISLAGNSNHETQSIDHNKNTKILTWKTSHIAPSVHSKTCSQPSPSIRYRNLCSTALSSIADFNQECHTKRTPVARKTKKTPLATSCLNQKPLSTRFSTSTAQAGDPNVGTQHYLADAARRHPACRFPRRFPLSRPATQSVTRKRTARFWKLRQLYNLRQRTRRNISNCEEIAETWARRVWCLSMARSAALRRRIEDPPVTIRPHPAFLSPLQSDKGGQFPNPLPYPKPIFLMVSRDFDLVSTGLW